MNSNELSNYLQSLYCEDDTIEQKTETIKGILKIFQSDRIYVPFFAQDNPEEVYQFLISLYLNSINAPKEYTNLILEMIDFLLKNVICTKEIFNYIFQSLSYYYFNPSQFSEDILKHYFNILGHFFQNYKATKKKLPNNYFYFVNNSGFQIPKCPSSIDLLNGFTIIMWFRLSYLHQNGSIVYFEFMGQEVSIDYDMSTEKFYLKQKDETINLNFKLRKNEYNFLYLRVNRNIMHIYLNEQEDSLKNCIEDFDDFILFKDCIGEISSVILLNKIYELQDVKKLTSDLPFGPYNLLKTPILFESIPLELIHSLYIPTYRTIKEKDTDNIIVDDYLFKNPAELLGDSNTHIYINYSKDITEVGGVKNLLPILEMIHSSSENNVFKLTKNVLIDIFDLILLIVPNSKKNRQDIIECKFFPVTSLFIERYPEHFFNKTLMKKLIDIAKILQSIDSDLFKVFFESILLNERIYFKFDTESQSLIWSALGDNFFAELDILLNYIPLDKICLFLKFYDEKKYSKYCCEYHKNCFIEREGAEFEVMTPNLKDRTKNLIELLQRILNQKDATKSEEPKILFEFLCLNLSPCLTKIVLDFILGMLSNKDLYLKFKASVILDNPNFNDIILSLFSRTTPDIRYQILYLISISQKWKIFDEEFMQSLEDNITLSDIFFSDEISSDKINDVIENLASHCVKRIQKVKGEKANCQQFGKKVPIFKQEYLDEIFVPTYNCLFQILLKRPAPTLPECAETFTINPTDNIFNENTLNVITKYIQSFEREDLDLLFLQDLDLLFSKNVKNCYAVYSCKALYNYLLKNIFDSFEVDQLEEKFELSKKILLEVYSGTLKQDSVINGVLQGYPTMMLNVMFNFFYNKAKDKPHNSKELEKKINTLSLLLMSDYLDVIEKGINSEKGGLNLEGNYIQNLITLFSIVLEYTLTKTKNVIFNENDCKEEYSKRGNKYICQSIPHFFLVNFEETDDIYLSEYIILEKIADIFKQVWDPSKIQKILKGKTDENSDLNQRNEDLIQSLLYEPNNKNAFIKEIYLLHHVFLSKFNWELAYCTLIYYVITLHRLSRKEEDLSMLLQKTNELKDFMMFYLLSLFNIFSGSKELSDELLTKYHEELAYVSLFYLCFLNEQSHLYYVLEEYRKLLKNCFTQYIGLCLMIFEKLTDEKEKKFKFGKLFSRNVKRKELIEMGLYQLCTEKLPELIDPDFIKRQKGKQFRNIYEDFNVEPFHNQFFNNEAFYNKISEFFQLNLDDKPGSLVKIEARINDKRQTYTQHNIQLNGYNYKRTQKIYELIKKYQITISKFSNSSFMVIKEKRNTYKKIKKEIFSFKGMWSNSSDLFQNKLKLKVLNHYTKNLSRPLLIPILDINYYIPNFSDFQTQKMFKTKSDNNVNLDIDQLLKGTTTQIEEQSTSVSEENFLHYIDFNLDKHSFELNYNLLLAKEEDFIFFFNSMRKFSKNENLRKNENSYFSCFVKPSHHIKGIFYINDDYINFNVFINQIKGNNIIEGSDDVEDVKTLENFEAIDPDRGTCFGSYFRYHHKDKDALTFKLKYDDLNFVFRRRYYQSNNSIEFFTKNHKSYYFVFKSQSDREKCLKDIIAHLSISDNIKNVVIDTQGNKDEFNNVIGYEAVKRTFFDTKKTKLSSLVKRWHELKISNFEFLMWLNFYSNRSFSDLSQYPVFPWIIQNYESPELELVPEDFRNLSLPMGMMDLTDKGEERKESYIQKYETLKENAEEFMDEPGEEGEAMPEKVIPYFFGSHYSNPIYTAHYLTRIFPYSHISIELQGNKFDQPDRLFLEIQNSFTCATEGKCDLRELIGEFYYLPEMFLNMNHLNLGQTEDGEYIENVVCPKWSGNNAYKFVTMLRTALESDYASQNLSKWIDLIFGSKQKGKESLKSFNLYYPDCYEIDVDSIKDPEAKKVKLRMVEFGLTPKQIFSSDVSPKKKESSKKFLFEEPINWKPKQINTKLLKNNPTSVEEDIQGPADLFWFKKFEENDRFLVLSRKAEEANIVRIQKSKSSNVQAPERTSSMNLYKSMSANSDVMSAAALNRNSMLPSLGSPLNIEENTKQYFLGKSQNYYGKNNYIKAPPVALYYDKNYQDRLTLIQGGFYHSKLLFTNIEFSLYKYNDPENYTRKYSAIIIGKEPFVITSIAILESKLISKENLLLTLLVGNEIGNVSIVNVSDTLKNPKLTVVKKLINNTSSINDIAVSSDMNIFASCSSDGYINMYTFTTLKLFRSLYIEDFQCDFLFISTCPLNCIIVINQIENKIKVYSINGEFLAEHTEQDLDGNIIKSPKLVRDTNFCEYLIYLIGVRIIIKKLPYLEDKHEMEAPIGNPEVIDITDDYKTMYITNGSGEEVYSIKNVDEK